MGLVKAKGNMYDWISHMHTSLGGRCGNECVYCYVQHNRFGVPEKYQGVTRLIQSEMAVRYGAGKVIFIEHCNDLFAETVHDWQIDSILNHTRAWPDNKYVFQTKNPLRARHFIEKFPPSMMMGTTIETNRAVPESKAPKAMDRALGLAVFSNIMVETFLTLEPIMNFDLPALVAIVKMAQPGFVNIGADSKRCNLNEPTKQKLTDLIAVLQGEGIEIRQKLNLERIMK